MIQRTLQRIVPAIDHGRLGLILVLFIALGGRELWAADAAPAAPTDPAPVASTTAKPHIVVKLVTDFESRTLVSDLEEIQEITTTVFDSTGSREELLGERCVLWGRNARVDDKFFFERFYQGKYLGRSAKLEIELDVLGAGEHAIHPGEHKFTLAADGKLSSNDPSILIDGDTLLLRMHRVVVHAVDAAKHGPSEFRLVSANLGLLSMDAALRIDREHLPDPAVTFDPQATPAAGQSPPPLTNMLSHQKSFYPLSVWLPANEVGQGYVLYPSWQAFRLTAEGKVDIDTAQAPGVPGLEVHDGTIVIPYRTFNGRIQSLTGLTSGVGNVPLTTKMKFGTTLAPSKFVAAHEKPPEDFFLLIDNDFSRLPHKFFLADNSTADKQAIRMLALEWAEPVYARASEATVRVRLLETAGKELKNPQARMTFSPYRPSNPLARDWQPISVLTWQNGRDAGELKFQVPDLPFGYVVFRVEVADASDPVGLAPLAGEISGCILERNQAGSASFVSNRGRTAFVAGEDIDLQLVLRSEKDRPASERTVVLKHPDGRDETLKVADSGKAWFTQSIRLPAARTVNLTPGVYQLSVRDLPAEIVSIEYTFDLAGRQATSLFHVVKPSKYTLAMNELETSHFHDAPIDLDRAMHTIADLGYTQVDLMAYTTNHHLRSATWREDLSAGDSRLPPPESVYSPAPRDQILNACVRNQLRLSDVWLSYNDFHLPRYIESYIRASERWIAREMQAMRHSPALDGMILYDEMYQSAPTGIVPTHQKYFASVRAQLAEEKLGESPAKIEQAINRYLQRPASQRDPQVLARYLKYQDFQQLGWADYVERTVAVGKALAPAARFGTYLRTWSIPGTNDDLYHGYPPDLFKSLDIISHIHYADNSTAWVSTPMLAQVLRTGKNKTLYVNMPLKHEARTHWDGQYQRQMAFALLAQGANGVAQWGLPHGFDDGPNEGTAVGRETTRRLNRDVLCPLGEIIDRTREGYHKIGIVSTKNQHGLSQLKQLAVANQTEAIWIACWRLGYPAQFLREDTIQEPLDDYAVLFVPGVRFDGELDEVVVKRLKDAITAGKRVVVESDSTLDLPGVTKLNDWNLNNYFVGDAYFPTWSDDELNKVYEKSQPTVDYLGPKLKEWGIEPAATGPFKVGPSWRDGGDIDYLVMANFDDPDYNHTVRQQMAKPLLMPLSVPSHHGQVAYDLLSAKELPLAGSSRLQSGEMFDVTLDMRQMQGAMVAFLPERVGKLQVRHAQSKDPGRLRLAATLIGQSGKTVDAVFPLTIKLHEGDRTRTWYRVLGKDLTAEIDLPQSTHAGNHHIEVRESISGQSVAFDLACTPPAGASMELQAGDVPYVPYPGEVRGFLEHVRSAVIVPSTVIAGVPQLAEKLASQLQARGIQARIVIESKAYRYPKGDPKAEDPFGDGFHSWHSGQEVIGPATIVDEHVILLGGHNSSYLLDELVEHGFLSAAPLGQPGFPTRPSIQVAVKGLHYAYDTLCLVANDSTGMQQNIDALVGEFKDHPVLPAPQYGAEQAVESTGPMAAPTAIQGLGTNELVHDVQFDPAGNVYAITWGHGKNLYSLKPDGSLRFARHLPEMGAEHLTVSADRLYAYTAAGARLYQLSLDNQPVAQARLNMDPGSTTSCDNYSLSTIDFAYLPGSKRLLHNMGNRMRLLDDQFQIIAEWQGVEYFDQDVADSAQRRALHGYAMSPDQQRIAQIETSTYFTKASYEDRQIFDTHLVIRDLNGKLLHEYKNLDNGLKVRARLTWPADAPGPIMYVPGDKTNSDRRLAFSADLQLSSDSSYNLGQYSLGGERRLIRDGNRLVYFNGLAHEQCRLGPLATMPTFAELSADGKWIALLDEYGLLSLFGTEDGKLRSKFNVPELGQVLRFGPNAAELIVGGYRGSVCAFDFDGKLLWHTRLGDANDIVGQPLPLYDPSFPDHTEKLWPTSHDEPGELEKLVRLGGNRLVNGDAETAEGWEGLAVDYHATGHESKRSLKVGPQLVGQQVTGFLGTHATWVLEFYCRSADDTQHPELLAGLMTESDEPDSVAAHFHADNNWRFNRVVIKNGSHCEKLAVGFSAQGGDVLVDQVQLRQIRFPSVNPMLYEPLFHLKPVVLENPLFTQKYDPVGNLREQASNRVLVPPLHTGAMNLVEAAYLQNGRINEIGSHWFIEPFSLTSTELPISLGIKEPRWISLVALYFNEYDPTNVTPHVDIYAADPETGKDRLMASVRHNGQRFRLIKFPPIKTSLVKVSLVNSIQRLRTLTEIELYGPLSGREGTPGFIDPEGQNTYMGDFTRVDKRTKALAPKYLPVSKAIGHEEDMNWAAPLAEILAAEDRFYVGRAFGKNTAYTTAEPMKELYWARASGLGFTPYGALYGGLLLHSGNDGKLYCLNPETGTELWSAPLGERLFGCPVAIGEDVFAANGDRKLVQLDLASGTVMKEAPISGVPFGSLATDGQHLYFITDDGFLHSYRVNDLAPEWQFAVAPFTDSTPAVDQGVVYLADQQGKAAAVDVATGKPRWTVDLGDEFCRCPVVTPSHVVFGCRDGTLAVVDRTSGSVVWSKKVESRFDYEPVVLGDQVLFFHRSAAMLARLSDGHATPLQLGQQLAPDAPQLPGFALQQDPIVPISYYKGRLFFIERPAEAGHAAMQVNMAWNLAGSNFTLLAPSPPPGADAAKP